MQIKKVLFIILTMLPLYVVAQEKESRSGIELNYGVKAGVHAATYNSTAFQIDGYEYDDRVIQSNKIGYSISLFSRLTKGDFYLQTEANFCISRYYFEFKEAGTSGNIVPTYELTTNCIQVPLLFGYNFVKSGLYGMSVFTGPKAKFILTSQGKQDFENFKYNDLHEDLAKVSYYWEIGLGINIANLFFDFVYDIGMNNYTNGIKSNSVGKTFYANRSDNLLSFSLGIMF